MNHLRQSHRFTAGGRQLAATTWGQIDAAKPTLVMLHGGLDCTSTWRDLPEAIVAATGLAVLSYDRYGYGGSEKLQVTRGREYRDEESGPVFADLLRHFGLGQTVLFGHSDGGAMGLLAAAAHPDRVRGVCACSPTVALDQAMVDAMERARDAFEHRGLRERLTRHHGDNTESMFWGWYTPWADDDAVHWSMTQQIAAVRCPVAAIFGQDDEYGWRPSARALVEHGASALEVSALPGVGHDPQHKAREAVLAALQRLLVRAS